MPPAATRGDGIRLKVSGVESLSLAPIGTIPGVAVLAAAGANGPGSGQLRATGAGTTISWRAPSSAAFGPGVKILADGAYVLEDGDNAAAWIRVQASLAYMQSSPVAALVLLGDVWSNALASDDVTAAEASAGDVKTYTVDVTNDSPMHARDVVVWLDAAVVDLEISDDGASWVSPTSEGAGLALPDLASGASATLHLRRTIGAAASSDTGVLNHIHLSWLGF